MGYARETKRFHIKTGPESLFNRVRFKMGGRRILALHGPHVQLRAEERGAPLGQIRDFESSEWDLRTADADIKTGKFVKSAWHRKIDGRNWWIAIGLGDLLMTVIGSDKYGLGPKILRSGDIYERIERVNKSLMDQETE